MNRKTSPYLGVLNEKKALKEPVGTFYHPSANHYRTGLCPVGKIERTGYEFKKSSGKVINVKTTCVKDVGSNGKTSTELANKLKVNPKELESYGYSTKLETDARHKALLKAIKAISYATTKRVLVLLRTQHKAQETNATKRIYNIYDTDIKWLTNYVEKKRSTSHNKDLFKKKSVGGANASGANASGASTSGANASETNANGTNSNTIVKNIMNKSSISEYEYKEVTDEKAKTITITFYVNKNKYLLFIYSPFNKKKYYYITYTDQEYVYVLIHGNDINEIILFIKNLPNKTINNIKKNSTIKEKTVVNEQIVV
jgi:hypothetical protein